MASSRRSNKTEINVLNTNMTLHEMFRVISDRMTFKDVLVLKHLYQKLLPWDIIKNVLDGYSFLIALERTGRIDEYNLKYLMELLRIITRHDLLHLVTLRKEKLASTDPVSRYMDANGGRVVTSQLADINGQSSSSLNVACTSAEAKQRLENSELPESKGTSSVGKRTAQKRQCRHLSSASAKRKCECYDSNRSATNAEVDSHGIRKRVSCGIRLRVRAEYNEHSSVLADAVHSTKPEPIERAFDKFLQANAILKSRDLGSIVCDIRFSELTYLDAFWRDYISGSLLEALKGIFITESLRQAVGLEGVRLLVSVDEDDYHAGRLKLLHNLT